MSRNSIPKHGTDVNYKAHTYNLLRAYQSKYLTYREYVDGLWGLRKLATKRADRVHIENCLRKAGEDVA